MLKQLLGAVLTLAVVLGYIVTSAHAAMIGLGNMDGSNGFPTSYQALAPTTPGSSSGSPNCTDTNSPCTPISLQPCLPGASSALTAALCGITLPNPTSPLAFPTNFPVEFFYWNAQARVKTGSLDARLILATEASFANGSDVINGQQITFSRIRIRISGLTPLAFYKVTHPYGVGVSNNVPINGDRVYLQADNSGSINVTNDYASR